MKLTRDADAWKTALGLTVVGLVVYGASFNDPFHFDDSLIVNDSNVTNAGRWMHFLNPLHLRQLTFFSFYLNNLVGGVGADGFHFVNVLLHIANAVLLYFLVGRFAERWIAIAAAMLFLVHPIQTEAVLYVYQRSVLLACFFSLLGAIALCERKSVLGLVFLFLAFEGKESALAVPLVIGLLHKPLHVGGRKLRAALLGAGIGLSMVTLALLAYWGEKTVGLSVANGETPLGYLLAQTRVFYTYLRLLFFPFPQSLEYQFVGPYGALPSIGLLAILLAAGLLYRNERWRTAALCIFAFMILLLPTSSIIPSADLAFEHRLYLPMLAFSVLLAWLASKLALRTLMAAAVVVFLGIATIRRGGVWSTDISLWEDAVKHAPGKGRAWFNLGGAYLNTDPDRARTALLRSIELDPGRVEAPYDLGLIEQKKGHYYEALGFYRTAVDKDPRYWPAWNNIGNTLFAMGRQDEAIQYFEKTVSLNRDYWPAYYNVAVVYFLRGRYREASQRLRTVLDWSPDFREARYLLSVAAARSGDAKTADEEKKKLGEGVLPEFQLAPPILQGRPKE